MDGLLFCGAAAWAEGPALTSRQVIAQMMTFMAPEFRHSGRGIQTSSGAAGGFADISCGTLLKRRVHRVTHSVRKFSRHPFGRRVGEYHDGELLRGIHEPGVSVHA